MRAYGFTTEALASSADGREIFFFPVRWDAFFVGQEWERVDHFVLGVGML